MDKVLVIAENRQQYRTYVKSHGFEAGVATYAADYSSVQGKKFTDVVMIGQWQKSEFANDPRCLQYLIDMEGQ